MNFFNGLVLVLLLTANALDGTVFFAAETLAAFNAATATELSIWWSGDAGLDVGDQPIRHYAPSMVEHVTNEPCLD